MKQFKVIISIVILVVSLFLVINQLFTPQPIQIILETGQEVVTQTSEYFSIFQVLTLIVASFLIGSTVIYLYFKSDTDEFLKSISQKKIENKYEMVIPLLRGDEKRVFQEIIDAKGEMLQNALVLKTSMTKVKMTRALASLENKNLILKERHGLTNRIKLK
ncbi:MAG: hypothetical protein NTY20_02300 [Candidatus Aenigmarchaeota archaeon]|nr:hypothetical protein [Candidatus Aenigmarchaeota archaeon]